MVSRQGVPILKVIKVNMVFKESLADSDQTAQCAGWSDFPLGALPNDDDNFVFYVFFQDYSTLKAPSKICSRRHSNFFFLFFRENKSWHFMWIICQGDDSHEMLRLVFSEKKKKKKQTRNVSVWHRCPRPGPSSPTCKKWSWKKGHNSHNNCQILP